MWDITLAVATTHLFLKHLAPKCTVGIPGPILFLSTTTQNKKARKPTAAKKPIRSPKKGSKKTIEKVAKKTTAAKKAPVAKKHAAKKSPAKKAVKPKAKKAAAKKK
ncbi:hypothetical protein ABVT39_026007 [Epinephelus coioides]